MIYIKDIWKLVDDDKHIRFKETKTVIEMLGGGKIITLGKISLEVNYKTNRNYEKDFLIIKEQVRPILGFNSLIKLNLFTNSNINMLQKETGFNNNKKLKINKTNHSKK